MSLYGDMNREVGRIMGQIPDEKMAVKVWAYFGKMLYEFFKEYEDDWDEAIVEKMLIELKAQNHSGGSIGVVTQYLFKYLSGETTEKDRTAIRSFRDTARAES